MVRQDENHALWSEQAGTAQVVLGTTYTLPANGDTYTVYSMPLTLTFVPATSTSTGSSSGTVTSSYAVSVDEAENGTVSASKAMASAGDKVTITAAANEGYELDQVTVTGQNGTAIAVTDNGNGTYTFTMPAQKVTVEATFTASITEGDTPLAGALPFTDVASDAWYTDAVKYVYANGLMSGTSDTVFSPAVVTTRSMIVSLLYRLEGEPSATAAPFPDVADGQWYTNAVNWAAANGIVSGYGDGRFGPADPITREQMASILYRYAQYKGYDVTGSADLSGYADASTISSYAVGAMQWANAEGLISGTSATTLSPKGSATRAEAAALLMRFCENVAK